MSRIIHRNQSQTPCAGRDEDILMYLHGALPPMARIRTARHIHRCADCQQRAAALAATSQALADTVRGDGLPRWKPPTLSNIPLWLAGGAAVLFFSVASLVTVSLWSQQVQAHAAHPPTVYEECRTAAMMEQHYRQMYAARIRAAQATAAKQTKRTSPSGELVCPIEEALSPVPKHH